MNPTKQRFSKWLDSSYYKTDNSLTILANELTKDITYFCLYNIVLNEVPFLTLSSSRGAKSVIVLTPSFSICLSNLVSDNYIIYRKNMLSYCYPKCFAIALENIPMDFMITAIEAK